MGRILDVPEKPEAVAAHPVMPSVRVHHDVFGYDIGYVLEVIVVGVSFFFDIQIPNVFIPLSTLLGQYLTSIFGQSQIRFAHWPCMPISLGGPDVFFATEFISATRVRPVISDHANLAILPLPFFRTKTKILKGGLTLTVYVFFLTPIVSWSLP